MNHTIVYHGAWLAFSILAIVLGVTNMVVGGLQLWSALLVVIGLLFGARSISALFITDEPAEVTAGRAYIAVAILLVMVLILVNEWVL